MAALPPVHRTVRVAVGIVLLLALLALTGCGGGGESESITVPDDSHLWPYAPAEELCGTQRTWPDHVRFLTVGQVIARFTEESGYALQRHRSLDIKGARTFAETKTESTAEAFGQFVLSVVHPACPSLIDWLGARGKSGPGGLVWERVVAYGIPEGCWTGNKRYPGSNVVVNWTGGCERRVNRKWKRLDAVLTEITAGR